MQTADFAVIILAGGQSRRMGQDKALLRLTPGGPTLIERVIAAARPLGPILLVTNTPDRYAWLGLPMVPDPQPGQGPLGGLAGGLAAAPAPYNLVLACDLPDLQPAVLAVLAAVPRTYDVLVPRWTAADGTRQIEPLHAVYSRACLPAIQAALAAGHRAVHSFYPAVRVQYLADSALPQVDPHCRSFRNLNTPADLLPPADELIREGPRRTAKNDDDGLIREGPRRHAKNDGDGLIREGPRRHAKNDEEDGI